MKQSSLKISTPIDVSSGARLLWSEKCMLLPQTKMAIFQTCNKNQKIKNLARMRILRALKKQD